MFFFRNLSITPQAGFVDSLYLSRICERSYDVFSATISCLMWYLFSSLVCVWFPSLPESFLVASLDRESLSMYLIHDPLNYPIIMTVTAHLWSTGSSALSPALSLIIFLIRSIGIYLISYLAALLIRKIPRSSALYRTSVVAAALIYTVSLILAGIARIALP